VFLDGGATRDFGFDIINNNDQIRPLIDVSSVLQERSTYFACFILVVPVEVVVKGKRIDQHSCCYRRWSDRP